LIALTAIILLIYWTPFGWTSSTKSRPCHREDSGETHYAGEQISWKRCGEAGGRPVECSQIEVPMDQYNATSSGDKTFNISLVRLRAENATKNLLLNPGGPGGSGAEFIFRKGKQLSDIVGNGFHLLSFDPRGINGSTPAASCYPSKKVKRAHSGVNSVDVVVDSPGMYAWTNNFVKACRDTMDEHGAYINTVQTAADMNSILEAVGQEDMVYWGFSYGTVLGQTYASLFPERSERVIIDGVANNFRWFDSVYDNYGDAIEESLSDTENVLAGFFDQCIKAGHNCTLGSLASSKEELERLVFDFSAKLREQPLSVYVNNTLYGLLDYPSLWYNGIFPALYKPAAWYSLSENLYRLIQGNATAAWLSYGIEEPFGIEGEGNQFVIYNDAKTGPAYWPQDRESIVKAQIPISNSSTFAPTENETPYAKQQWAIPRTHNFSQPELVNTAHPLLILSTTFDPVCPLKSAKTAYGAFNGSQLIEVEGYGHCSIAMPSTCLAMHVRNFLYNGTLPDEYTRCEVDGPYFIKPEDDGQLVAQKAFDNDEMRKIHIAQLELATEWEWEGRLMRLSYRR